MVTLTVNGERREVASEPDTPLLYVLRDELELHGAKYGCGLGQCGSCTVMVDGTAVFSCVVPILVLEGKEITTVEGLGTAERPGPMQQAFIDEQAAQCGFCIAGMIVQAQALLQREPEADEDAIRRALEPNLCRCGTHMRILKAVRRAQETMRSSPAAAAGGARTL